MGLEKTKNKLEDVFSAHNVDSWVLANNVVGGHNLPDNKKMIRVSPLHFSRRKLHYFQPSKNGERNRYGGTKSGKYTKGMLIKHKKYGICYVGGYMKNLGISLHKIPNGTRLCRNGKEKDIKVMCQNSWRMY